MSKSCELHLVPNCPLCAKQTPAVVSPAPQNNLATILPVIPPPAVPPAPTIPTISDPHAQKMLAAAEKYAAECEAVKTISEQVTRTTEILAASKEKLKEAQANRDAAQKEMLLLLNPMPYTVSASAAVKILNDAHAEITDLVRGKS